MRNIYFISNMYQDLYPDNSRSKFSTYINQNCLKYIPSGQIEAAIKNITFDNTRKKPKKSHEFLGIKSNISDQLLLVVNGIIFYTHSMWKLPIL